jgi:hypothetical protein
VGPQRFWMCPTTLRSSHTVYATAVSSTPSAITILTMETRINSLRLNEVVFLTYLYDCSAGVPPAVAGASGPRNPIYQEKAAREI